MMQYGIKICVGDVDLTYFHQQRFSSHFRVTTVSVSIFELLTSTVYTLGTVHFSKK